MLVSSKACSSSPWQQLAWADLQLLSLKREHALFLVQWAKLGPICIKSLVIVIHKGLQ